MTQNNVPENLPRDVNIFDEIKENIPKNFIPITIGVVIVLFTLIISIPKIHKSILLTKNVTTGVVGKVPELFPNLTLVATTIGGFVQTEAEGISEENLASISGIFEPTSLVKQKPLRITNESLGVDSIVYNPNSIDNTIIETLLEKGVVRYPRSAILGEKGNVYLLGNSEYFGEKIKNNSGIFNNLKDISEGDIIIVQSENKKYSYKVTKVSLISNTNLTVNFDERGYKLTLITCNSFTEKEDRLVIRAELVGK